MKNTIIFGNKIDFKQGETLTFFLNENLDFKIEGDWMISENGGFPLAWVENNGNGISYVSVSIEGVPENWIIKGVSDFAIAPGHKKGLELELIPFNWDNISVRVEIIITTQLGITISNNVSITHSNVSWGITPFIQGMEDDLIKLRVSKGLDKLKPGLTGWAQVNGCLLYTSDAADE